jgi:hypothetical protein
VNESAMVYCFLCTTEAKKQINEKVETYKRLFGKEPSDTELRESTAEVTMSLAITWGPVGVQGFVVAVPLCMKHLEFKTEGGLLRG